MNGHRPKHYKSTRKDIDAEIKDTLRAIKEGEKEYKEGKTIVVNSLADLL